MRVGAGSESKGAGLKPGGPGWNIGRVRLEGQGHVGNGLRNGLRMDGNRKFVAILTASPALGSILAMVLDCEEHLVVHGFSRPSGLKQHMRIVPIDLIVCDFEISGSSAARLAVELRAANPNRQFEMIALARDISGHTRQACKFAAIDEVIIKPMSPLFVRDRVLARLEKSRKKAEKGKIERKHIDTSNVIELFAGKSPISSRHVSPG